MSVVRSAYRQILRVGARAKQRYDDPNDLCFALFGVLLTRHDFIHAGYGSTLAQVGQHAFARPSIAEDATDSTSVRLQASFAVLRRLHELTQGRTPHAVRQRRREVRGRPAGDAEGDAEAVSGVTVAKATASSSSIAASPATTSTDGNETAQRKHKEPEGKIKMRARDADAEGDVEGEEGEEDEGEDEDDDVIVGSASIFLELSHNRKVQQEVRHFVMCRDKDRMPPYMQLLPPEPVYLHSVRHAFPFLLVKDAVACMAATSRLLQQQQRRREQEPCVALDNATTPATVAKRGWHSTAAAEATDLDGSETMASVAFPSTAAGFETLLRSIPTRAVARTDCVEVEVCTQYICSNPLLSPPTHRCDGGGSASEAAASTSCSGARLSMASPVPPGTNAKAQLFMYHVFVRNLSHSQNPKRWHVQLLSQHVALLDLSRGEVVEVVRPGVAGNFPQLAPGESHIFSSGTSHSGPEAVLRGTIQINAVNEDGQMRVMDVAMPPTRLSTSMRDIPEDVKACLGSVGLPHWEKAHR